MSGSPRSSAIYQVANKSIANPRATKRRRVGSPQIKPRPTTSQLRPKSSTTPCEGDIHPHFRFLDLPPEIRRLIYIHHFTLNWPDIEVRCVSKPEVLPLGIQRTRHPALKLLETCRQIYQEAYHHFYRQNVFSFRCATSLYCFLLRIGQARREQIRGIHLSPGTSAGINIQKALLLLRTCHRLREFLCVKSYDNTQWRMAEQEWGAFIDIGFHHEPIERLWPFPSCYIYMERPSSSQEVVPPEDVELFNQKKKRVQRTEAELLLSVEAGKGYYCSDDHRLLLG